MQVGEKDMKILLASPRGFCAGVNMAIESLQLTLEMFGAPVYVLSLIHISEPTRPY